MSSKLSLCGSLLVLPCLSLAKTPTAIHQQHSGPIHYGKEQNSGRTLPYQIDSHGMAIIHGDIVAGPVETIRKQGIPQLGLGLKPPPARRGKRSTWQPGIRTWPNNTVYYSLHQANTLARTGFLRAVAEIEANSAVRFVEKTGQPYYVNVASVGPNDGCQATLGFASAHGQVLQLPDWCAQDPGSVLHETLHTLGFSHEQQRPDRDQYITLEHHHFYDEHGQRKATGSMYDMVPHLDTSTPYDLDSVMHYPGITPRPPYRLNPAIGRSVGRLSPGDIAALQRHYPGPVGKKRRDPCSTTAQTYRTGQTYGEEDVIDYHGARYQLRSGSWQALSCGKGSERSNVTAVARSEEHPVISAAARYSKDITLTVSGQTIARVEKLAVKGVGTFGHVDEHSAKRRMHVYIWPLDDFRGEGSLSLRLHFHSGQSEDVTIPVTVTD